MRQYKIPLYFLFVIIAFINSTTSIAFGHGEDKPGPHGGQIRMPGALHVEVLPDGDSAVKVYVLDVALKNPVVVNSQVIVSVEKSNLNSELTCATAKDHFVCTAKDSKTLLDGSLIVEATRGDLKGIPTKYSLPLRAQ